MVIPGFPIPVMSKAKGVTVVMVAGEYSTMFDYFAGYLKAGSVQGNSDEIGSISGQIVPGFENNAIYTDFDTQVLIDGHALSALSGLSGMRVNGIFYEIDIDAVYSNLRDITFITFYDVVFVEGETYNLELVY